MTVEGIIGADGKGAAAGLPVEEVPQAKMAVSVLL